MTEQLITPEILKRIEIIENTVKKSTYQKYRSIAENHINKSV